MKVKVLIQKILKIIGLTALVMNAAFQFAQSPAVETGDNSLNFRGQGPNPWCFAFAEEQVLKDHLCQGTQCLNNADRWEISIFDIAIKHGLANHRVDDDASFSRRLFRGSSISFPYLESPQAMGPSRCSLEKTLFKMNRSKAFNPFGYDIGEMALDISERLKRNEFDAPQTLAAIEIYQQMLDDPNTSEDVKQGARTLIEGAKQRLEMLEDPDIQAALITLSVAHTFDDPNDFVLGLISMRTCNDKLDIPEYSVHELILTEEEQIRRSLSEKLQSGSVLIGICAEVLESVSKFSQESCGGHAVTIKSDSANQYLVVDSAFFSPNPTNQDGSQWIDKSQVHHAITKFGKVLNNVNKSLSEINQQMVEAQTGAIYNEMILSFNSNNEFSSYLDEWFQIMITQLAQTPPEKYKIEFLNVLSEWVKAFTTASEEQAVVLEQTKQINGPLLNAKIIDFATQLDIKDSSDLTPIIDFTKETYETRMKQILLEMARNSAQEIYGNYIPINIGGNIVWLEEKK